jgi:hypothetical protein
MAATGSADNAFTFVKGLVTEGGFMVHPKDAWKEGYNVIPNVDGTVERRLGFDFEPLYSLFDSNISTAEQGNWAYVTEKWESVNGNGSLDFFVVQAGPKIYFYESSTGTTSSKKKAFSLDLNDYGFSGRSGLVGSSPIKASSAYGKLVITNRDSEPILVIYNSSTDTISAQKIELLIRDFDGIRSPVPPTTEYTQAQWQALSFWPQALYNLYNQGWKDAEIDKYKTAKGGVFPGNNKQWVYGKDTNDSFDVAVLDKQDFGSMVAPKGRVILKAFYQDRSLGLNTLTGTNTGTIGTIGSNFPIGNPNIDDGYPLPEYYDIS